MLAEGKSLPAEWYPTPEVLDVERRQIFARSWQYAGHVDMIPEPTDSDIDHGMSGNICRCGTYVRIREAIKQAAKSAAGK